MDEKYFVQPDSAKYPSTSRQGERHIVMAEELKNALRRYFPLLNFTLVIATFIQTNAPDIRGVDGVIEFKIDRSLWPERYGDMYRSLLRDYL